MKKMQTLIAVAAFAAGSMTLGASADVLAYWAQNDNELPGGGFGFMEGDFPQAADVGSGWLTVGGGNILATDENGIYTRIQSFAGTILNALDGFPAGGSIAFQGGTGNENNGAWMQFEVSTAGYENLVMSFATQRTATGFNNNQVSFSTDGENFTDFGDSYDPATSWELKVFDFGSLLDDLDTVYVRITFDGASAATGNNRLDNILFEASALPAPGALALLGLAGIVGTRRRRN
jgi:MYXO-CTERM domain-containing protein